MLFWLSLASCVCVVVSFVVGMIHDLSVGLRILGFGAAAVGYVLLLIGAMAFRTVLRQLFDNLDLADL